MPSLRELEEQHRAGKISLPTDPTLRGLVIFAMSRWNFDPLVVAKEFNLEIAKRDQQINEEANRLAAERERRVQEEIDVLLSIADKYFEFKLAEPDVTISAKAMSLKWPSRDGCPMSGQQVGFEPFLYRTVDELARQIAGGNKKRNKVNLIVLLSKIMDTPNMYFQVYCGQPKGCRGFPGERCQLLMLKMVRRKDSDLL